MLPTKEEIPSTIPKQEEAVYKESVADISSALSPQPEPESMTTPVSAPLSEPEPVSTPASESTPVPIPVSTSMSVPVTNSEPVMQPVAMQESASASKPMAQSAQQQQPEKEIVNDVDTSLAVLEARCKRFGLPFDPAKYRSKAQTPAKSQPQQNNVSGKLPMMM